MFLFKQLLKLLTHPMNKNETILSFFRLVWWKTNQIFFKIPAVIEMVPGARLVCYPSSSYGSFVVYAKFPEYEEMQFIHSIVFDKDIFFDVGANIGSISVLAASKGAEVKIHAFEPTKSLVSLFKENININGYGKRITLIEKAVFHKKGTINFLLEKTSEINHIIGKKVKKNSNITEVETVTLDDYTEKKKLTFINFLKVDVEGAELQVFQGAKNLLKNSRIGIILFEINKNCHNFGYQPNELVQLLKRNNYFIFSLEKDDKMKLVTHLEKVSKTINLVAVRKNVREIKRIIKYLQ